MKAFLERINGAQHETALRVFLAIVLAHWGEHLLQAFQIYGLGWPPPEARGVLGYFFPGADHVEILHYGYAVVMLVGLWVLRSGFTGVDDRRWWTIALGIQFFTTSSTRCCRRSSSSATTCSIARCRRACCSCGCRASSCTFSTTPSCSFRWWWRCLPHVPACRGEAGRVHVRLAPEAVTGGVNARLTLLCGWACCAIALATGCGGRPADVGIAWTIEPSALVAGSTATVALTLAD